jgi:hypothetical protein
MHEERCLGCGKVLFRKVQVDEVGHTVIQSDYNLQLEENGFERFLRCPTCQAAHVVASRKNLYGIPQLVVSHLKT